MKAILLALAVALTPAVALAHSGGLDAKGCHAGSKPYHCHTRAEKSVTKRPAPRAVKPEAPRSASIIATSRKRHSVLSCKGPSRGSVFGPARIRDGDTFVVRGVPVRLKGIDCPEMGTSEGRRARDLVERLTRGKTVACSLTGETTYDRQVGYCSVGTRDIGRLLILHGACTRYAKYDTDGCYK